MNYEAHCKRLFYNLPDLRKLVKDGRIAAAQDWLADWWYAYEVAKCETAPPGDYSMSREGFDDFMAGFFNEDQILTVWNKVVEKRIVDEHIRITKHVDKKNPIKKQGDLF